MTRPNIVYLHGHDIGRHIQPYGYPVHTPNLQRLAEQGILFRQAHTAGPTCSTSRAALLTGQSPHNAGMLGLAHRGFALHHPEQHLASLLATAGYQTVLAGFQHVTHDDPATLGYTTILHPADLHANTVMRTAAAWLEQHAASENQPPFFLDAGALEAHRPFPEVPETAGRYLQPLPTLPDAPQTRHDTARFQAAIEEFDRAIGHLLQTIGRLRLAESTVIVCTTDHGPPFPRMKCNLTAPGTAIMLIIRGPHPWSGGKVTDQLVSNIDLFPTICELAGIECPAWAQGFSIEPLARHPATPIRAELFAEVTYHAAYEPMRAIRTDRWTFIHRFSARPLPVLPNCDEGESKALMIECDWNQHPIDALQLYDNLLDPWNMNNLHGHPAFEPIETELASRLESWMEATDDPLIEGDVPLPPGGFTDPVDGHVPDGAILQATSDVQPLKISNSGTLV